MSWHFGRSFVNHPLEDDCPCPQEACGLVDDDKVAKECPEHNLAWAKTIRQSHMPEDCPGG